MNDQLRPVSFGSDIKPLFRSIDIDHMKRLLVGLDDYNYMSDPADDHEHAKNVQNYLAGTKTPRMPIGGPYWTQEQLKLYEKWMTDGYMP